MSDWFPHVGGVIDDIAVVRSMWCNEGNHFPAVIETCTGHRGRQFDHPTFGSWVSYALGTANKNLPTFVNIGRPSSPVQLTGGYLGATVAATPFQAGETPIPNLYPPEGGSAAERERQMQALLELNREFRERYAINSDIAARAKAYELAARMQLSAPEVVDFSREPQHVTGPLRHRREGDRRFRPAAAPRPAAGGAGRALHPGLPCRRRQRRLGRPRRHQDARPAVPGDRQADRRPDPRPQAARHARRDAGGLGERVRPQPVVAEHDRPRPQPQGLYAWLAGGGVKGGVVHGATDDVGYKAVEHPHYYSDLHATILHQLGLDYQKMEVKTLGRTMKLVEEGDGPIKEILTS